MDAGRAAVVAVGVLGALWAHHRTSKQQTPHKRSPRRRVGRQQQLHSAAAEAAPPVALAPVPASVQARRSSTAGRGGRGGEGASHRSGGLLLLLLLALLSASAIFFSDHLRPASFSTNQWQQHVSAASLATACVGAVVWLLRRRPSAAANSTALTAAVAAAQAEAQLAQLAQLVPAAPVPAQDVTGVWLKDKELSDSMDEACDAMQLGGLVRTAIKIIKGVQLRQDEVGGLFTMSVLSGFLWFKITERYPMDGTRLQYARRDLRRGKHTGYVERCPLTGGVLLKVEWAPPHAGTGCDLFHLVSPDVLHVETSMVVDGRPVKYRQVYHRKR